MPRRADGSGVSPNPASRKDPCGRRDALTDGPRNACLVETGPLGAVEALARLGGVCGTRELRSLSSRTRIRTAVRRGEIVRVGRDRLALPVAERALAAAHALNGCASHLSAAAHHGWEIAHQPELPQVTVPRGRVVPAELPMPVDVRRAELPTGDRGGWVTTPVRTVIDCIRDLPFTEALAVADSALRHGDVTPEQLQTAVADLRGPTGRRLRRAVAYADGRAAGPFESVLRALAIAAGLECVPQYQVQCGERLFHPDLANPLWGIALEADSWTWHAEKWQHDRDCARYNALVVAGWIVLRFTYEHVMHSPGYVIGTIRALLAELGANPAA